MKLKRISNSNNNHFFKPHGHSARGQPGSAALPIGSFPAVMPPPSASIHLPTAAGSGS